MRDQIKQIRQLLDELERAGAGSESILTNSNDLPAAEMAVVIQEIVDDLQPLLTPYQATFYWYLFRHSIARNGIALLRVGQRGLQTDVVKPSRPDYSEISQQQVKEVLAGLESTGAIRKEGEPNREGTLYRVLIPDEIEACREYRRKHTPSDQKPQPSEDEVDFYNVKENRIKVYERDGYKCRYCGKQLTRFTCTLDHVTPVAERGTNSFDNLVTACLECNSRKHKRPLGDFLAEQ